VHLVGFYCKEIIGLLLIHITSLHISTKGWSFQANIGHKVKLQIYFVVILKHQSLVLDKCYLSEGFKVVTLYNGIIKSVVKVKTVVF
jgi:hypothetical protein